MSDDWATLAPDDTVTVITDDGSSNDAGMTMDDPTAIPITDEPMVITDGSADSGVPADNGVPATPLP